LTFLYL